jgi:hypothetical protein
MPNSVAVRYSSPALNMLGQQGLCRRAMFVCAEALRGNHHDQLYCKVANDPTVPAHQW